jgi:hypothetical protein
VVAYRRSVQFVVTATNKHKRRNSISKTPYNYGKLVELHGFEHFKNHGGV